MKTDRELIELAAKAAGISLHVWGSVGSENFADMDAKPYGKLWNPLTDDGDALRLAISLRMSIDFYGGMAEACWFETEIRKTNSVQEPIDDAQDARESTRRAITRAAAEIQLAKERA